MTWRDLIKGTERSLGAAGVDSPNTETRWIIESVSGASVHELGEGPVTARAAARVDAMVGRRAAGEPLQYVLGSWAFRGLELYVDGRVLIPRPETEVTAELAINACALVDGEACAVDLGTGSGAIALAIAAEVPRAHVWATDASEDALAVARANLAGAGTIAARVQLAQGDWFDALPHDLKGKVHVLVSNPPYVADDELSELPPEVREYEPHSALVAGSTGFESIEHLIAHAPKWLSEEPAGTLVIELAPHQADRAVEVARANGFEDVRMESDLSGRHRVLVGSRA